MESSVEPITVEIPLTEVIPSAASPIYTNNNSPYQNNSQPRSRSNSNHSQGHLKETSRSRANSHLSTHSTHSNYSTPKEQNNNNSDLFYQNNNTSNRKRLESTEEGDNETNTTNNNQIHKSNVKIQNENRKRSTFNQVNKY